ncbi:muramoyltetrapeptide carboxypeptidase [Kitasatospora gansuensis]|uniref:Muramoyltetrapeptide carboxypeptidase n=1 Tax=Kitasatospora gansuensis TaxID=258050 RepID=A0A7W7SFN9_9ACTN|nr:LD-carboxypeptidase [Kitasatospora gansuensis]MBB4949222.1 muramoyltetrapeptide carboxypeptidase [Kitasatospora gansuensis]
MPQQNPPTPPTPSTALRRARRLVPGDRVALVATSGAIDLDQLTAGTAILRSWGLDVVPGEHLTDRHLGYLAGTDADRAADFQRAWLDPTIAAVICARGGYGVQRMVDLLDWDALRTAPPKALVGFSDITVLHETVAQRLGVPTLYGPMGTGATFIADPPTAEHLRRTLFTPDTTLVVGTPGAGPLFPGTAHGVTAGGCAHLLAAERGTATARPSFAGTILLLEDISEHPYQLDRIVTQLIRSGALDGVAGIALGSWEGCEPLDQVRAVLADRLAPLGVPVAWELGFGHCPSTLTVPLGLPATLDADAGTLTFDVPVLTTELAE